MKNSDYEEKAFLDVFLEKIKEILSLRRFKPMIDNMIVKQYVMAMEKLDNKLDVGINFVPSNKDLEFLKDYVNKNIQTAGETIANNLRQEIARGIMNGDKTDALIVRVRSLFKEKAYQVRLKMIIRTETLRANNQGTLDGAKQAQDSGVKLKKWLSVIRDKRTSDICFAEHKKYGSEEQAVPLDEDFVVTVKNKTFEAQIPPFHPNCRTVVRILEVEDDRS